MKDLTAFAISLFTIFSATATSPGVVTAKEAPRPTVQSYPAFEPLTPEESKSVVAASFPRETVLSEPCSVILLRNEGMDEFELYRGGEKIFRGTREKALAERERLECR